ncbi:laminin subunit alpha-3, partial [Brachyhypopomus gauderio]|uniref:laminin subunit alpha-3 n=1 Tax=Brachyhypopomus gauderio TaxID=698409 RepID=UPI0040413D6D
FTVGGYGEKGRAHAYPIKSNDDHHTGCCDDTSCFFSLLKDSILVLPEEAYHPELLSPEAQDQSFHFTSQCGAPSFSVNPHTSSEFCKSSARSLVAHYHNGALPCDCDKAGSISPTCQPIGGQCRCRPHVIGRQCTRCATGFYGFPYCRPCECGRRLCDEVTGECVCPPQTLRPACEVCEGHTFSYHPLLGCENCNCSTSGIPFGDSGQCHVTTGQCTCKPRVGGRRCSRCLPGYYGFPDCVPCSCHSGGVTEQICDSTDGRCVCKSNVEGLRCDMCRRGAFHFHPTNPKGCTECFCFGATDQCRSSEKRRSKFVDMRSWRLVTSDLEEVPSVLNTLSNTVVSDVQELFPSVVQLNWVLPRSYLGDRVSSYGGYLTFQTKSFGIPHEMMKLQDKQPDVLLKGQNITLVYQDAQSPSPDRLYQGRVQLVEGNFRHSGTNRPASRDEFMRVLAGLQAVWIRALYFSNSQRLSVGGAGLEEASPMGSGGPAHNVEVCACPKQYAGDSCQRCAPGFYRDRSDRCVPCACNGLSDVCEESTGRCQYCQADTAGYHCERCKEGYYGSAALRTCRICPCPHGHQGNNFAVGCSEMSGRFRCLCKPGYAGERCQRCDSGYYGDPEVPGGSCRPCNCNSNSCSPKTGVCSNTQEPKDTNTHEECPVCDSCAQTLLVELEQLDDKLAEIKTQLDAVNSSSSARDRLKKLEEALAATKVVVTDYSTAVDRLTPKVTELESDSHVLVEDINLLKQQAEKRSKDAQKVSERVDSTHQKAQDLNTQTLDLLRKIQELLKQLSDSESGGGTVGAGDSTRLLEEAERMVREMEARRFEPQRKAAEKELDEAQKLLEYIKNNCTKQYEQNQEAAKKIRGLLKDFEAKLKELEEALKQARDMVQKANSQNSLNSQTLTDLLKRITNLEKERDNVAKDIIVAKRQLQDTENLLKKLSDGKKEYEQLAAQLDGAKTDLSERVNNISQAAGKEDLVKRAEDHAALLNRLANELQEAMRNSSGRTDVKDALAAIDVYKNITEAVKAAEEAANKAKEAADKAQNDVSQGDIPHRAKTLKDKSNKLLKDAKNAAKDLKQVTEDLTNQQKRLGDAEKKKATLEKELLAITDGLKGIQRDDIAATIDEAKQMAMAANASASDTLDKLRNISDELAKISVTPTGSNIDRMLDDVDMTVKNLSGSIPSLLEKITQVESLSSQIDPKNNISNNINRIKELIEQARDAANRIAIPMKFTGNEFVELRPPKNLADVRAYTAFNLLLQRPKRTSRGDGLRRRRQSADDNGNLFVLYLGNRDTSKDYLGMVLRKNVLYFIYKLNGNVYEIQSDTITDSDPEPAFFDKVDVSRIYQDAEVKLTKLFTSNQPDEPLTNTNQGKPSYNLLDLDPSEVVFYVGGYPDDFTPPDLLNFPKYRGCIELSTFNERFISLYNFKALKPDNVTLQVPCKRYVMPTASEYFEGSGYAQVQLDKVPRVLSLVQTMETRAENAVLLYMGDESSFYCITLEQGYMVLRGRDGDKVLEPRRSENKQDVNGELKVIFDSGNQIIRVRVKNTETTEVLTGTYSQGNFKNYYIGGVPNDLRERDNITTVPLKGCVSSVNAGGRTPTITEKVGVSRGCPKEMLTSRKAEFCAGGSLETSPEEFDLTKDVTLSLGFRTTETDGLLLQNKQADNELGLKMVNGSVMLKNQDTVWKSKKQYQDGEWHYLTVTKRGQSVDLRVDEEDVGEKSTTPLPLSFSSDNIVLGKGSFSGCLANVYLRRPQVLWRPEDLSTF